MTRRTRPPCSEPACSAEASLIIKDQLMCAPHALEWFNDIVRRSETKRIYPDDEVASHSPTPQSKGA
jgi:hypothetical protein